MKLLLSALTLIALFSPVARAEMTSAEQDQVANFLGLDQVEAQTTDLRDGDRDWDRRRRREPVVCFARSFRGALFEGRGWDRYEAERNAYRNCEYYSHSRCREAGCRF